MSQKAQTGKTWAVVFLFCLCWVIPAFADDSLPAAADQSDDSPLLFSDISAIEGSSFAPSQAYLLAQANTDEALYAAPEPEPQPQKAPPLPLHTLEGVGGALAVPMAYMVNPGPEGTVIGMPSVSFTYLNTSKGKDLQTVAITETFWRRLELGYALTRFNMGNLPHVITKNTGLSTSRDDIYLHHFNIRGLVIEENTFGPWCPSVVAGAQIKYNESIREISDDLMGAPEGLGFDKSNGVDYVLTLSKTIPPDTFGLPPIILTVGMRNSKAANLGLTGFGKNSAFTVEADIVVVLAKNFAVGYEFRQKNDPYHPLPGVFDKEENWHAIRAAWIINDRLTLAGGLAHLGNVGNTNVPLAWGLQLKYEF